MPRDGTAKTPKPSRKPRARDTGPTKPVKDQVKDRDQHRCVICGAPLTEGEVFSVHHRANRGAGGRHGAGAVQVNRPSNLLTLCGSGTTECHGWVTAPPRQVPREHHENLGWVVSKHLEDPSLVPVWTWDGWKRMLGDGGAVPLDRIPAPPSPLWPGDTRDAALAGPPAHHLATVAVAVHAYRVDPDGPATAVGWLLRVGLGGGRDEAAIHQLLAEIQALEVRAEGLRSGTLTPTDVEGYPVPASFGPVLADEAEHTVMELRGLLV